MARKTFQENGVARLYYCLYISKPSNFNILIAIQAARHVRTIFPSVVLSFVRKSPSLYLAIYLVAGFSIVSSTATTAHINGKKNMKKVMKKIVSQRPACVVHGVSITFSKEPYSLVSPMPRSTRSNVVVCRIHCFCIKIKIIFKNKNQVNRRYCIIY